MVGRNSSMWLTAFCMTTSNTHSRGRHSSSISFVEDAGKYLREDKEKKPTEGAKTKKKNEERREEMQTRHKHIDLQYTAQSEKGSKPGVIPRTNCVITEDVDLQSAAFDQSLQNVVH